MSSFDMRKDTVRAVASKAVSVGTSDVVGHVTSAAGEAMRTRRDPSNVARRRVRAAKRRVSLWSVGAILPAAGLATSFLGGGTAVALAGFGVARTVLYVAILMVCLVALVRSVVDLRARQRVVAALPSPPPARRAVNSRIRPEINQLGGYSDSLRQLAQMTGIDRESAMAMELRRDIISAADSAERTIRARAADLSGIYDTIRASPPSATAGMKQMALSLTTEIRDGVASYGELVAAASEIVVAANALRSNNLELSDPVDQLRALASGMRELAR
ncbi:hypothetical protein EH165_05190 [Nakamurella antarctica]|uniref:Uncharacterized protein n=1 Tax=Nakamurella antarctica TaxID=1902245 RepID=A0A3G8ZLI3_9ACTN|nr:hypothetical protein [Nakamurella antarctica]AZI57637.1 hypothetical protein EH165_05190 [Nakamurella antarctica]